VTALNKRTFSRTDTSTSSISLVQTPLNAGDRDMQRIKLEAELEDTDIACGMSAQGTGSRERPYGGRIMYSFLIDKATRAGPRVQLLAPVATTAPIAIGSGTSNGFHRDRDPQSMHAGPTDNADNPLGIVSATAPTHPAAKYPFTITMQPPRMTGKSFRLARAIGSRRVLSFKISKKIRHEQRAQIKGMFAGKVLLVLGRAYRAFWATPEGDNVFAVETGDELPRGWKRPVEPAMPGFLDLMAREY
jgi:hypothetical protein